MRRAAVAILSGLIVLLAVAQLALPPAAEDRVRDELEENGEVAKVDVDAFPAIKLLWGSVDSVEVEMGSYRSNRGRLGELLDRAGSIDDIDATAREVRISRLRVTDGRLTKRGEVIEVEGLVTEEALRSVLPPGMDVRPVASENGELVLEGSVRFLGFGAAMRARVRPRAGAIVVQPEGIPLVGRFATVTVFKEPGLEVVAVGARSGPGGFTLTAEARLLE